MPYVEEEDLLDLHKQIEKEKEQSNGLIEKVRHYSEKARRATVAKRIFAIFFTLLLLSIAGSGVYFYYFQNPLNSHSPSFKKDLTLKNDSIADLLEQVELLSQDLIIKSEELTIANASLDKKTQRQDAIVYSVQIGTFEKTDLDVAPKGTTNLWKFTDPFFIKYAVGTFKTVQEARNFRKVLFKIGFKDCFVISIKNGKRLKIESSY